MATTVEDLRTRIRTEERLVGVREVAPPREAVHRRRTQLAAIVMTVGVAYAVLSASGAWLGDLRRAAWVDPGLARVALAALAVGIGVYVLDREQHLKRIDELGRVLERRDARLVDRMLGSATLVEVIEDVHATLDLDDVLDRVLRGACRLVDAGAGTVTLVDRGGAPHVASLAIDLDAGVEVLGPVAGLATEALEREMPARRVFGDGGSIAVPLVHRGRALGTLAVVAAHHPISAADEAALLRLAPVAATAIAHAAAHEALRYLIDGVTIAS